MHLQVISHANFSGLFPRMQLIFPRVWGGAQEPEYLTVPSLQRVPALVCGGGLGGWGGGCVCEQVCMWRPMRSVSPSVILRLISAGISQLS